MADGELEVVPQTEYTSAQIDVVCDRFEAAWKTGEASPIDEVVQQAPQAVRGELLLQLLLVELHWRLRRNEHPDQHDYERRFPDHVDVVHSAFHRLGCEASRVDTADRDRDTSVSSATAQHGLQQASNEADELLPGHIGRYQVRSLLGQGAFGNVYLAYDDQLHRQVAIKVPRPERIVGAADVEVYLTEARVVANLDHPHIVPVHDVGRTEDDRCFVVSKFIEGRDLRGLIQEHRPSYGNSAQLVATIAEALHYAHQQQITHRDIKPSNILVDAAGTPYVADFGLALKDEDFGRGPSFAGTPSYMSPEQARGEGHLVDGRSDVFSLGIVLYELLTGARPFTGSSWREVTDSIARIDARPPRKIDDTIPKELERICQKALSKRVTDRYMTAKDLAEDLHYFLAERETSSLTTGDSARPGEPPTDRPANIVPKGLRSFDAGDADFFLELLPGPRDRDGLPESIRFWKTRIEETDRDGTFRVGLIYGPSGCGKSSLVKTGLLPRLADHVVPVYIEGTGTETESRLLRSLRDRCPDLPADISLIDTLATLRRGRGISPGKKVLIVIDQFEQWLHAAHGDEGTDLVQALRHCDGARLQCITMVRDDFWMAATQFMREFDLRLVEAENCHAVDRFLPRHAEKVLASFGRAFGELPEDTSKTSDEQEGFLKHAVSGLAEEGKVVCVRLALFAEMVKGKPWTPATLADVGGTEGVGVTFLEETFSASTASPEHRLHQEAARSVLKALLPASGTDIKVATRSYDELLAASGYSRRPDEFHDLIHRLDSEIRLITPTDPAGIGIEDAQPTEKYYQLTHDYLVPSLRAWLTQKQQESWRGRAEMCLQERTAQWHRARLARLLPGPLEYVRILAAVPRGKRTAAQRTVLRAATRRHGTIAAAIALVLTVLGWGSWQINGTREARRLVQAIGTAKPAELPNLIANDLPAYRRWANESLKKIADDTHADPVKRLNASLAMVEVDRDQVPYLHPRLLDCLVEEFPVIRNSLEPYKSEFTAALWKTLHDTAEDPEHRFRAGMALAEYTSPDAGQWTDLDADFLAGHLLDSNPDDQPALRGYLAPIGARLVRPLEVIFRDPSARKSVREAAANALADVARADVALLASLASEATPAQYRMLFPAISRESVDADRVRTTLVSIAREQPKEEASEIGRVALGKRRAGAAISLVRLNEPEPVLGVFHFDDDPESLTQFVHRHKHRGVTPARLIACLDQASDVYGRFGLILALGEFESSDLPTADREAIETKLATWYGNDPSSAIHGACGWLLRKWALDEQVDAVNHTPLAYDETGEREWFVQKIGESHFTFIVFPPGEFLMGSPDSEGSRGKDETLHKVQVTGPLAVCDREVTVAQWLEFDKSTDNKYGYSQEHSPTPGHPTNTPDWYMAVEYCRWLTQNAGLDEADQCYDDYAGIPEDQLETLRDGRTVPRNWPFHPERRGFRLPTNAEWEYIGRAGTRTTYGFGSDRQLLGHYGWFMDNSGSKAHIGGELRPNFHGLFDVHGNVWEWCHEWDTLQLDGERRLLRGGGWNNSSPYCRSANRDGDLPTERNATYGFRVVWRVGGRDSSRTP